MYVYMAVTADELELPVAIADTTIELAEILSKGHRKIEPSTIRTAISRKLNGNTYGLKYLKVWIDDYVDEMDLKEEKEIVTPIEGLRSQNIISKRSRKRELRMEREMRLATIRNNRRLY